MSPQLNGTKVVALSTDDGIPDDSGELADDIFVDERYRKSGHVDYAIKKNYRRPFGRNYLRHRGKAKSTRHRNHSNYNEM